MRPHSPFLDSQRWKMGEKNKFALKCISGKIKCFKTMFVFFLMENRVVEDPPSQLNRKFHQFLGARAPLGLARVKYSMKKFRNSYNLLATTCYWGGWVFRRCCDKFPGYIKSVSRVLHRCYKSIKRVLHGCFRVVSRMFQVIYEDITRVLKGCK